MLFVDLCGWVLYGLAWSVVWVAIAGCFFFFLESDSYWRRTFALLPLLTGAWFWHLISRAFHTAAIRHFFGGMFAFPVLVGFVCLLLWLCRNVLAEYRARRDTQKIEAALLLGALAPGKYNLGRGKIVVVEPRCRKWYRRKWYDFLGELHRLDGPAVEYTDGGWEWYVNGSKHRADGPAAIRNGRREWWLNGEKVRKFTR